MEKKTLGYKMSSNSGQRKIAEQVEAILLRKRKQNLLVRREHFALEGGDGGTTVKQKTILVPLSLK